MFESCHDHFTHKEPTMSRHKRIWAAHRDGQVIVSPPTILLTVKQAIQLEDDLRIAIKRAQDANSAATTEHTPGDTD